MSKGKKILDIKDKLEILNEINAGKETLPVNLTKEQFYFLLEMIDELEPGDKKNSLETIFDAALANTPNDLYNENFVSALCTTKEIYKAFEMLN